MAILGITNRTENWKTATYFAPLFGHKSVRLARCLLPNGKERVELEPGGVGLELFWHGMRDHLHKSDKKPELEKDRLASIYRSLFRSLQDEVQESGMFQAPPESYDGSRASDLASNLFNTEIDVVLESPSHLFIGEAKHESEFGSDGANVLTHQLIRQYVMASVLVEFSGVKREVVPFVVGDDSAALNRSHQVQFMRQRGWMRKENILTWNDIEALW